MTSKPPLTQPPGGANTLGLPSIDQDGQFYKSAVRFTRAYAMFSPTMVGLLLAKKTRFGRFIPLPDALPDGFRLGSLNGDGTADKTEGEAANGAVPHAENGKVAAPHSALVAEKPGVNGTIHQAAQPRPSRLFQRPALPVQRDVAQGQCHGRQDCPRAAGGGRDRPPGAGTHPADHPAAGARRQICAAPGGGRHGAARRPPGARQPILALAGGRVPPPGDERPAQGGDPAAGCRVHPGGSRGRRSAQRSP